MVARERITPRMACFELVYSGAPGIPCQEAMEPMRMSALKVEGESGFRYK